MPSGSWTPSSSVSTVSVAVPEVPIDTVRAPSSPSSAKSPLSTTVKFTVIADLGAGDAVSVKVASSPSVMSGPAAMLTTGGSSSSTATLAEASVAEGS